MAINIINLFTIMYYRGNILYTLRKGEIMLKLMKYLKPFWLSLVFVVALLFAQAQCELTLPDYMSNIVTNGIQNGGIESAALEAMRSDEMDKVLLFVDEADQATILSNYTKVEKGNTTYIDHYPQLKDEAIYVLNEVDEATKETISSILSKPLVIVNALNKPEVAQQMGVADCQELFAMIQTNPQLIEKVESMMEEMGMNESSMASAALLSVKSEYQALGMNTDSIQINYILQAGLKMLGIALIGAICAIAVGFLSSKIAAGLARNLREKVFTKVENFSSNEFNKFSTASLITRTTNDVQQVQQVMVMMLRIVIYAPIMGIGAILKVLQTNGNMVWIIGLVLVVILSVLFATFMITMPKFKVIQKLVDRINLVMREFLSGMPVIRAFNTEKYEEKRFEKANRDITKVNLFVNRTMASVMPIMNFVMSSVSVLIIWVGAQYIDLGTLEIGQMMAFSQYAMQILMCFIMIAMIAIMIPQASVSALRIVEVIDSKISIDDPEPTKQKKFDENIHGEVVFDHVYFQYPGAEAYVLENISFKAKPGQTTAFIGSTGSGKSTLINLIPRFFDVTDGKITIDGIDIRDVTQHDLRDKIGYVPQKGVLFSGDIESNLRYAKEEATEEDLRLAIEVSQSKEFIDSKPEGIETPIAQGGTNVSGGQKQRLSIARALTKNPEIYIFDDSFSALDFKTDSALREALNKLIAKTKSTVFIVAQRISTIMTADQIVVLDQGKIAGIGTHDELMKNCEVYQEIAYSQLSKEELNHE